MELNELLSESRKKRQKRKRMFVMGAAIAVAVLFVLGIVWLFLWSPLTRVDRIVAKGNVEVSDAEIVDLAHAAFVDGHRGFLNFPGDKNILMWPSVIAPNVLASQPQIAHATLTKDYGAHAIVITVAERQPFAIWCLMPPGAATDAMAGWGNESCYWFDRTGTLFAPTFDTEGDLLLAVHDYSENDPKLGDQILPDRFLQNFLGILDVLRPSGLRIKEVRLNDLGLEEIQVTTYNGPSIYFSLRFPPTGTLAGLQDAMGKPGFDKLQYVDFRTQGRMYYQ